MSRIKNTMLKQAAEHKFVAINTGLIWVSNKRRRTIHFYNTLGLAIFLPVTRACIYRFSNTHKTKSIDIKMTKD